VRHTCFTFLHNICYFFVPLNIWVTLEMRTATVYVFVLIDRGRLGDWILFRGAYRLHGCCSFCFPYTQNCISSQQGRIQVLWGRKLVGPSLRKIIKNYKYKTRYESGYLFRAPPTAFKVARAREGPWSLSFINFTVNLPLVHKHLE
jgi:hypothetical protein